MKKLLKLTLLILLVCALVFTITGCGKKEENTNNNGNTSTVETNGKSKTYNTFSKIKNDFVISMEGKADLGEGEENMSMTMAVKGQNICMDVKTDSEHATIIYKDSTTYIISHDEKMYMSMEGKDEDSLDMDDMPMFSEEELQELETAKYTTGKETIDGTEYDYEEYKDEENGTTERYYFTGNELKYIKSTDEDGEVELMKVNKISADADDSLFEIPSDYQKIEL